MAVKMKSSMSASEGAQVRFSSSAKYMPVAAEI